MGTRSTIVRSALTVALALAAVLAGCSASSKAPNATPPAAAPSPVAADYPSVVTDLSKLSSADTVATPLTPEQSGAGSHFAPSGVSRNDVVGQKLAANAKATRYDPTAPPKMGPSRTQLLNDKARRFANFSDLLLEQTLLAAQQLAPDKLQKRRVPEDLNPVLLTAILDAQGRLREIIIDQHSGDLAVDKLFIEACKKGCWSRNPPADAHYSDGGYHLQIKGSVFNSSFDRYGQYTYDTEIGLAIL